MLSNGSRINSLNAETAVHGLRRVDVSWHLKQQRAGCLCRAAPRSFRKTWSKVVSFLSVVSVTGSSHRMCSGKLRVHGMAFSRYGCWQVDVSSPSCSWMTSPCRYSPGLRKWGYVHSSFWRKRYSRQHDFWGGLKYTYLLLYPTENVMRMDTCFPPHYYPQFSVVLKQSGDGADVNKACFALSVDLYALRQRQTCITSNGTRFVHAHSYVCTLELGRHRNSGIYGVEEEEEEGRERGRERERAVCACRRNAMAPCDHNTSSSGGGGPFKRRGLVFLFGYLAVWVYVIS